MPRYRLFAISTLLLSVLTITFAQEKKDPPVDPKTPPEKKEPVPAPAGPSLTWKFTKDVPIFQELTTTTEQNITVQGLNVGQNQSQTFWFKFHPLKQEAEKWTVKQSIEGLKMKIEIAGSPINYDSTNEGGATGASNALNEFFKGLKGSEFTLTINKDFAVEKIEGREELIKKLSTANKTLEPLLNRILGEESMKQMADPTFGIVPKEAKKVGESWERKVLLELGPLGSYDNTYKYTYEKQDGDIASIKVDVNLAYKAPPATEQGSELPFKIKDAKLPANSAATNGGVIKFNTKTGMIETAEVTVNLAGTLTLEISGSNTVVELKQKQTTTIKNSPNSLMPAPAKK
ncbi:MAG: DUF6263 family protein [Zavarzinella sp.]